MPFDREPLIVRQRLPGQPDATAAVEQNRQVTDLARDEKAVRGVTSNRAASSSQPQTAVSSWTAVAIVLLGEVQFS